MISHHGRRPCSYDGALGERHAIRRPYAVQIMQAVCLPPGTHIVTHNATQRPRPNPRKALQNPAQAIADHAAEQVSEVCDDPPKAPVGAMHRAVELFSHRRGDMRGSRGQEPDRPHPI